MNYIFGYSSEFLFTNLRESSSLLLRGWNMLQLESKPPSSLVVSEFHCRGSPRGNILEKWDESHMKREKTRLTASKRVVIGRFCAWRRRMHIIRHLCIGVGWCRILFVVVAHGDDDVTFYCSPEAPPEVLRLGRTSHRPIQKGVDLVKSGSLEYVLSKWLIVLMEIRNICCFWKMEILIM